ncbi:hypothetical protein AFK24_15595 [Pseudomonas syringae]|uniref:Uncharacterized protein n=1 Tax=Pseudomonas syringae TaxID=317 RepID=A0A1C7Z5D2_PSESX|nr:hypothetical protein [Pseudomonas syringae]OCR24177.1 hypothetical protein AFK24_15595 [Pseudomonas syringae]
METIPSVFQMVFLPYGLWQAGQRYCTIAVRPISGHDEILVEEALAAGASVARAGTLLIGLCASLATEEGAQTALGSEAARTLTLGDRELLFRAIFSSTFSPKVASGRPCPGDCGETIEFDLDLSIAPEMPPEPGPIHHLEFMGLQATCRLLTGADLEEAAGTDDPVSSLCHACTGNDALPCDVLAQELTRLDPNAETVINLTCAACGHETQVYLDGFELIRHALATEGGIFRQIHILASAYGWREQDILAIPRARRRRYCALANE